MKADTQQCNKKNYRRPELITYGDIHKITQAVGMTGAKDGGMGMNGKTSA